ncbi:MULTISPECIES: DNA cytosine methyltransferase [unclassified Microcoleus]|uniref:DNA cytosine methyltransferase n=1 Tax=unclassified Microcoleus TaxID=2642155 RepID=UPI004040CAD0
MQHIDGWLDLCSGIGAGFPYAGIKLWERSPDIFCEWNEYCQSILRRRFPNSERFSNIKAVDFGASQFRNRRISIVTASPPCQPFTNDGKRLAARDDRDCFPAVLAAIYKLQPNFAIIENVAGLLNCPERPGSDKLYFAGVLNELSESGYDVEWQSISSAHFGSPWRRERVVIVAIARSFIDYERATPWQNQIGESVASIGADSGWGGSSPGIPREWISTPQWLHESTGESDSPRIVASPGAAILDRPQIGVASRDGDNRDRREALGNALDWRVAAIGLKRVEYLSSLAAEHRSANQD